jgi:hypothetical protein
MNINSQQKSSNRNVRITILVVGVFAIMLFVFLGTQLLNNPSITVLQCTRANNSCTLTLTMQKQTKTFTFKLNTLIGARVVYPLLGVGSAHGSSGYQVYLYSKQTHFYVTEYNSLSDANSAKKKINEFLLDKSQPELIVGQDEGGMNAMAWILMGIMPLLVIGALTFAWRKLKNPNLI